MMKRWNFFLAVLVSFGGTITYASDFQTRESIRTAVATQTKDYLIAIYGEDKVTRDIEYRVSSMDSRLKLVACQVPLHTEPKETGFGAKRISVKVMCSTGSRWTIYVPVSIDIFDSVAVSTRNLQRGERISATDFVMKRTNTSVIGQSFIDSQAAVIGMVVSRPVRSGSVIKAQDIKEPVVVSKGDTITLLANQGALQVSSEGVALANGRMGEQIRVQNARSRRVVDARVTGPGRAEVW